MRAIEPFETEILQTTRKIKTTDSDKRSIGYETMTTLSDSDSKVSQIKVNRFQLTDRYWGKNAFSTRR